MKKVLLDCGTHFGQGLNELIQNLSIDGSWTIHTFEANPETYKKFVDEYWGGRQWITHHNKAISDHDGTITINLETFPNGDKNGMGSSIVDLEKWNPWNTEHRNQFIQQEIPCIDFSKFIKDNFNKDDEIAIKMDIEGAEFDVLDHMFNTNAIEYVNSMYIEWHAHFFTNRDEMMQKQNALKEKIKSYGIKMVIWK